MAFGHRAPGEPGARSVPDVVDRLIVHQIDIANPVPGGIDGAIRGFLRFSPASDKVAVVGVLADEDGERTPGRWELHDIDGRQVAFLPVARLDAADQRRVVPHSIRLVLGLVRFRSRLPKARSLHAHRADTAWASSKVLPRTPLAYFIHTQAGGLSTGDTDSFWRRAPLVHRSMERSVVKNAASVVVFNKDYASALAAENPRTVFSPSWFEPDLMPFTESPAHPFQVAWLGRLEGPKDPALALDVISALVRQDPANPWTLQVVGSGTLLPQLERLVAELPADVSSRVTLAGRMSPRQVGEILAESGVFLMTSRPGYEGHPRVLIEALASGLPAVVTEGSDTGGLIQDGLNGYVRSRDPEELAAALQEARGLSRSGARESVQQYSAPAVVNRILSTIEDNGS
jgi:glycosyltransferase involved in cell wall biosynthesis